MDYDYFDKEGEVAVEPNQQASFGQTPPNNNEDQFVFTQSQQKEPEKSLPFAYQDNTYEPTMEENDNTRRMREEEELIQEQLRQKSNKEYELKQQRREEGQRQMQEFVQKKEKEKEQRKKMNIEKQVRIREQIENRDCQKNWKKVSSNIALKQGEHQGKQNINRMREAIINKKMDENP